ncbi:N-formylglutamate amidohydrolase [Roseovarius sp. SCSIO 43702]|nr:N-formylglutamate amidohydrolase [Roseovarius sp. SCSIO 43702]
MKATLLGPEDPAPFETVNGDSRSAVLLICEHGGQEIPRALGDLGLCPGDIDKHVGWDIGAAGVARRLADALGAPLVIQPYSRLVIDCNRPPEAPDAMPEMSDGVAVPGNRSLDAAARSARETEIFRPFHAEVERLFEAAPRKAAFAIHSFTPVWAGEARAWDVGFLFRHDSTTSPALAEALRALAPDLTIGLNEPYQIEDASDWFVPRHGEARGVAHSLIEIRNDLIADEEGEALWADRLARIITEVMETQT